MNDDFSPFDALFKFPLMSAIFGRRSRRFGLGMTIPSGPLAYKSKQPPVRLHERNTLSVRVTPRRLNLAAQIAK
jgi:hypothetical protein